MAQLHAYLNFNGNCEEAFKFYESVFNTKNLGIHRYESLPENTEYPISEEDKNKVMHTSMMINDTIRLMGSDSLAKFGQKATHGNGTYLMLEAADVKEANHLYNSLSKDALQIEIPLSEQFWAELYSSFMDKFGVAWIVHFAGNKVNH